MYYFKDPPKSYLSDNSRLSWDQNEYRKSLNIRRPQKIVAPNFRFTQIGHPFFGGSSKSDIIGYGWIGRSKRAQKSDILYGLPLIG